MSKTVPIKAINVQYQNNPVFEKFTQNDNGFGFSNFRTPNTIPEVINRSASDLTIDIEQASNPLGQQQYDRHADFLFTQKYPDHQTFEQQKLSPDYIYLDVIKTIQERNPLIDAFFSKRNIDHIQMLIIDMINFQSQGKYKISPQRESELLTIMRGVYLQTQSNHLATGKEFHNQLCTLNKNVLDFCVPQILVSIQGYLGYARDQGSNINPMPRPEFLSNAGNKINSGFSSNII